MEYGRFKHKATGYYLGRSRMVLADARSWHHIKCSLHPKVGSIYPRKPTTKQFLSWYSGYYDMNGKYQKMNVEDFVWETLM